MKYFFSLIVLFALISEANAKYFKVGRSGSWDITSFYNNSGKFNFCDITAVYKSGIRLGIGLYSNEKWALSLYTKNGFTKGDTIRMKLYIDKKFIFEDTAKSHSDSLVFLNLPNSTTIISALRRGYQLDAVTSVGKASFNLTGTGKAIKKLWACVQERKNKRINASAPPRTRPVKLSNKIIRLPRKQLIAFAQRFAKKTGRTDYKITGSKTGLSWKYQLDNKSALLFGSKNNSKSVSDIVAESIEIYAKNCTGRFLTGKRPIKYQLGAEIGVAESTCQTGTRSFTATTTVVRKADGTIWELSIYGDGNTQREILNSEQNNRGISDASFINSVLAN